MNEGQKFTGAEILSKSLIAENANVMFGIPGGVVLPFYDSLVKFSERILHVTPRQEQGGGFAADGYARASGKVGIALGTSGPGATNLLTSMVNSMLDSVPVIFITGQVVEELIGTDSFQETDIIGMSVPAIKHSYLVTNAKDISRVVKEAFYLAQSGRPGPIHLDFVKDVWSQQTEYKENPKMDLPGYKEFYKTCSELDIMTLDSLFSKQNLKPVIIAGHGIELSQAEESLYEFAKKQNIPVVNTLLGLGSFPQGDPLWCGMIGMHGDAVANEIVSKSNMIIGAGCRFDDRITGSIKTFIKDKVFVHIDIDPSEIGKNVPTHIPLIGDAKDVLKKANSILDDHTYSNWWEEIESLKKNHGFLDFKYCPNPKSGLLSQPRIVKLISDITQGDAIVTSDVGRHQMWTARFYRFNKSRSHISSGGLGSMGYGLPAALGAKLACPDREVWAICGDGGFKMNAQELGTFVEHNVDVNIVIMEDNAYGMVLQWQNLLFEGNISHSRFTNPDFVKLADAYGIPAWKATTYKEAETIIKKARSVKGPALLVFKVAPDENVFPMVYPNSSLNEQKLHEDKNA